MTTTIEALTAIAQEAGAEIQKVRACGLQTQHKGKGELVTSADFASHEVMIQGFEKYFPGVHALTEEGNHEGIESGVFLVADELDGTIPFTAGSEHWAVMIALIDKEPTHGVIHLPDMAVTITAAQGQGCRLSGNPVRLTATDPLSSTLLGAEINPHLTQQDWNRLIATVPLFRAVRSAACAAASTYELLKGVTHVYLNFRGGKIWDFAAPAIAISEAGGAVSDIDGQPLRWDALPMNFLAAANAGLRDECLRLSRTNPPGLR